MLRLHPGAEAFHTGGLAEIDGRHILIVVGGQLLLGQVAALCTGHRHRFHHVRLLLVVVEVGAVHVNDPVISIVVRVANRIVAIARLALVRIRLDVHVPAATAAVLVALGIAAIGSIALTPV